MADRRWRELALLSLLALLWGSSYLFIKVAVAEIPPLTLIAARVAIAAGFLFAVMALGRIAPPRGRLVWGQLYVQAVLNSIGSWTLLAWGQQHVDAGLA
ncbi:MAG: DMT family transporter, partial [Pseudomonadota bacterium]